MGDGGLTECSRGGLSSGLHALLHADLLRFVDLDGALENFGKPLAHLRGGRLLIEGARGAQQRAREGGEGGRRVACSSSASTERWATVATSLSEACRVTTSVASLIELPRRSGVSPFSSSLVRCLRA